MANRLLRRVHDFWLVDRGSDDAIAAPVDSASIAPEAVEQALSLYEIDSLGLDRLDREVLRTLIVKFEGQPVGLGTLAAAIGEEPDTLEHSVEPFLLRKGLLLRTPRGRQATPAAERHLAAR